MINNANFLCEIGTEEIPAGYIPPAIETAKSRISQALTDNRIGFSEIGVYATPRRLAVMISGLADKQRGDTVELKGPSKSGAYADDGSPSKALAGFMKGNGVSISDLYTADTDKGTYVYAKKRLESKPVQDIIPLIIIDLLNSISFPKRMRWSDKNISYPRPVSYFLIMFNDRVIPFEIEGIKSSNLTRGHFIQNDKMIAVEKIASYESLLKAHSVVLDQDERKKLILENARRAAEVAGGMLKEDDELLDTVTFIVEQPYPVVCDFREEYLSIPDIVLIAEMKEHQKYFAMTDKNGRLINKFIAVSNNPPTPFIKAGNERVISARFSDAEFFYREDRKKKLIDRTDSLKNVLFHKELGSIYAKIERMIKISDAVCAMLSIEEPVRAKIERAALLCKADLVTALVFEFSSLQGKIGKVYALEDGEDPEVAEAIDAHYRPRSQGDDFPAGTVSVVLSIAEKLDNIFGSFSVGNIPKGSHDPYALRRQANAVVEMIIRSEMNISLEGLLMGAAPNYKGGALLVPKIIEFVSARARTIYSENGFSHDEIEAGLSTGSTDYLEIFRRAKSLNSFRSDEKFSQLLLAFKRMNNIVNAFRKDNADYKFIFNEKLFEEDSERDLYNFFNSRDSEIKELISSSRYIDLFKLMIQAGDTIDTFFDKVLVMDKKIEYRDNRLYLLEMIISNFKSVIDFSKIS